MVRVFFRNILFYLLYWIFLFITKTIKTNVVGVEQIEDNWAKGNNAVFCTPHHALLALFAGIVAAKSKIPPVVLLASLSDDGELISKLLKKFGFEMIRGSSRRGAQKAMRELVINGKSGKNLGIAFDGPKGPPLIPKRGLIGCARANKGKIYLIYTEAIQRDFLFFSWKPFRINSWDRMLIPIPFCSIKITFELVPEFLLTPEDFRENEILNYIEKRCWETQGHIYKELV